MSQNAKKKPLIWILIGALFLGVLPLVMDLLGLINFITGKDNYKSYINGDTIEKEIVTERIIDREVEKVPEEWDHVIKNTEATKANTDTILAETRKANINIDSIMDESHGLTSFINYFSGDTTSFIQSEHAKISIDVHKYITDIVGESNNESRNSVTLQFSELPPPDGMGRLAVRGCCRFCNDTRIKIYKHEDLLLDTYLRAYDSLKKEESTFTYDLIPGRYTIEIEDYYLGSIFFTAKITAGSVSLYTYDRKNPFGENMGRIAFVIKNPIGRYNISIDKSSVLVDKTTQLTVDKDGYRLLYSIVPGSKNYWCTVENLDELDLMDQLKSKNVRVYTGGTTFININ